ncbi:MAG: hypothetical protein OK441_06330 [Thaumarchaeota archaeon]|nr:hypothetical protein [Nitrososphaerota archaeon]
MSSNPSRRVALASLFGVLILVSVGFLPAPTSDYLIIFEAFFLALSFLVAGRGGATYVGVVAGILITFVKPTFFPLDLVFATLFGILVDGTCLAFGAKKGNEAQTARLVSAMTISTGIVGFTAYYFAAVVTNLVPNQIGLDATVLIFGIFSGAIGGLSAARVWNRYLKSRF